MKVAINKCFGGFGLSPKATLWLWERGEKSIGTPIKEYYSMSHPEQDLKKWRGYLASNMKPNGSAFLTVFSPDESTVLNARDIERTSPLLIECVETLGEDANGWAAELSIVEIPDGTEWEIDEYDGTEHIAEKHRTWR